MSANKTLDLKATAYLCSDKGKSQKYLPFLLKLIPVLAGALGTIICYMSCVGGGISLTKLIIASSASCIAFSAIFSAKGKNGLILFCTAAVGFFAALWLMRERFCAGMIYMINVYISSVDESYIGVDYFEPVSPETAISDGLVFMIFISIIISAAYSFGIVRNKLPVVLLVSVAPVEMCLFFGLVPDYTAFFCVLASWFAVFAIDLSSPDNSELYGRASSQCGIAAVAAVLICFALGGTVLKSGLYHRPEIMDEINSRVTDYVYGHPIEKVINDITTDSSSSVINHGKLGEQDKITFSGNTALEVVMPNLNSTIYLRGFTGADYTGNSWKEDKRSFDELNPLLLHSKILETTDTKKYSFAVQNVGASSNYLYLPYNLVPSSVEDYSFSNGRFIPKSTTYYGDFFYTSPLDFNNEIDKISDHDLADSEYSYRQYVYANYLDVPQDFKGADVVFTDEYYNYIGSEDSSIGKSSLKPSAIFGRKLDYIHYWLQRNCEYDLEAGKLPTDKDFADYFLTESHRGSCSHFATAAVLLCRYAGIPARYVEGYIVKPRDFSEETPLDEAEKLEITDYRAHAWAEIYVDNFGWYPLEFTSGYGNVRTYSAEIPPEAETASSEPIVTEPPVQNENITEQTEKPTVTESHQAVQEGAQTEISTPIIVEEQEPKIGITAWLIPLAVIIIAVCVLILRRRLTDYRMQKLKENPSEYSAVCFKRAQKYLTLCGITKESEITYREYAVKLSAETGIKNVWELVSTAMKAEFGCEEITESEAEASAATAEELVDFSKARINSFRKMYVKYILCY